MSASSSYSNKYLEYLTNLISQLDREAIGQFADLLLESRESQTTTFFLGNGGSAANANHINGDFSKTFALSFAKKVVITKIYAHRSNHHYQYLHQNRKKLMDLAMILYQSKIHILLH